MKPWENHVSQREAMDKPDDNGTYPVRGIDHGITVITSCPGNIYVKAAKYGISWWGHIGILADKIVAHENKLSGLPLCEHCDGTGNAMYSMYQECSKCHGRGVIVEAKS